MRRLARPKPAFFILVLIALMGAGVVAQQFRLFERAWFNWQVWGQPVGERAIGLADYRVSVEGQVIEGLDDDVSALTYDPVRKSLFTVTNKNAELVELSLAGKILRRISLVGFGDAEAVEFISDNIYVINHNIDKDPLTKCSGALSLKGIANPQIEVVYVPTVEGHHICSIEHSYYQLCSINGADGSCLISASL